MKLKKTKKNYPMKNRLKELGVSVKCKNIHMIGVPEEEDREKGTDN